MKLNEVLQISYHDELNPKLWDEFEINSEVSAQLSKISDEFISYLDIENIPVTDVILTGSNANFNWTKKSDIDLHVVIDMKKFKIHCPDLAEDFFNDKKTLWNEQHDITIYDQPVELYAQDSNEQHIASGIYSIKNNKWLRKPTHIEPEYNDSAVEAKASQLKYEIDLIIDANADTNKVDHMKQKIKTMRQSGLETGGEFSTENLAFKELRNSGYLEKLSDYGREIQDNELSL